MMRNNRVTPLVTVPEELMPSAKAPKLRNKSKNIKKWIKGLSCGTLSLFTCCMCCGCCGSLELTDVFDTDEEDMKKITKELTPTEKKVVNSIHWFGAAGLAFKCCFPTCGCCCGCCGVFSPLDAAEMMTAKK